MKCDPSHRRPTRLHPLALAITLAFGEAALALPQGEKPVAGQVSVTRPSAGNMLIQQRSASGIVNWQGFSIDAGEAVRIQQPQAGSVLLNRVVGSDPSRIFGQLSANGKVFLLNPSGVLFGAGARVDVGSLVASTLSMHDHDFLAGRYWFSGNGGATVNEGHIKAAERGTVALLGGTVRNDGSIEARLGTVALAAGSRITLDLAGDGLSRVAVTQAAIDAQVANGGAIVADGGAVLLTAGALDALVGGAVNHSGVVRARSLVERDGRIVLDSGDGGATLVSGTLDATGSAPGTRGGDIQVLGRQVSVTGSAQLDASGPAGGGAVRVGGDAQGKNKDLRNAATSYVGPQASLRADATERGDGGKVIVWGNETTGAHGVLSARGGPQGGDGGLVETSGKSLDTAGARVDAAAPAGKGGSWLLDPTDITIDAALAAQLSGTLSGGTSVTVQTSADGPDAGDITVNASIGKRGGADATLTLAAHRDIVVNGVSIDSTVGRLNVDLDSNLSGTGGAVLLDFQTRIATNGGSLRVFGRGDPVLGAATGYAGRPTGVAITGAEIDTRAVQPGLTDGSIQLRGVGARAAGFGADNGVLIAGSTLRSGAGDITIEGRGTDGIRPAVSITDFFAPSENVLLPEITTTDGNISITGRGGSTLNAISSGVGVSIDSGTVQATGSGRIRIEGTGGVWDNSVGNAFGAPGVSVGGTVKTNSGSLEIIGTGGGSAAVVARQLFGGTGVSVSGGRLATQSGALTITGQGGAGGDGMRIEGAGELGEIPSVVESASGNIMLRGRGGDLTAPASDVESGLTPMGVLMSNSSIRTGAAGAVTIDGTGGNVDPTLERVLAAPRFSDVDRTPGHGISMRNMTLVADGGRISLTGVHGSDGADIVFVGSDISAVRVASHALDLAQLSARSRDIGLSGSSVLIQDGVPGVAATGSVLDASAASGGGSILIQASEGIWTGLGTVMRADTLGPAGNGGSIRLITQRAAIGASPFAMTTAQGEYSARGGAQGGNGGLVEISGPAVSIANFSVDASAPNGRAGTWSIDPVDVTISNTPSIGGTLPVFTSNTPGANILAADISRALNTGTSVSISTGAEPAVAQQGNISWASGANVSKTAGGDAALSLNAVNHVIVSGGVNITSTVGRLDLLVNSDADAAGGGAIRLGSPGLPLLIATNGGSVLLFGQNDAVNGRATGTLAPVGNAAPILSGVTLDTVRIDTRVGAAGGGASGDIVVRGQGVSSQIDGNGSGIATSGGTTLLTSSGNIVLDGIDGGGAAGVSLGGGLIGSGSGAITVTGIGRAPPLAGSGFPKGVFLGSSTVSTSAGGTIDIRGRGEGPAASLPVGVTADDATITTSGAGPGTITISGESTAASLGLVLGGVTTVGGPATSGNIILRAANAGGADSLFIGGTVRSSGVLNIRPGGVAANGALTEDAATPIELGAPAGGSLVLDTFELAQLKDGFSSIVIGSNTHTGLISVVGPVSFSDKLTLQNGGAGSAGIDIANALAAPGNLITLSSGGTVRQSAPITAGSLLLHGTQPEANFQLTSSGNRVGTLASRFDAPASSANPAFGDVNYVNAAAFAIAPLTGLGVDSASNAASTIAAANSTSAGDFFARSLAGNLTLGHGISTLGSDITLVSAGVFDNAADAALAPGGSGRWRVWADTWVGEGRGGLTATTPNPNFYGCAFGAAVCASGVTITATGNRFIYAQRPTVTLAASNQTRLYGSANPVPTFVGLPGGLVNGDTATDAFSGTLQHTAQTASPVGQYAIMLAAALASPVGYNIAFTPGTLDVTRASLTISADSRTRLEGTPNPPLTATYAGLVAGDTPAIAEAAGFRLTTAANLRSPAGAYAIVPGPLSLANYSVTTLPGTLTVIGSGRLENPARDIGLQSSDLYERNQGLPAMCSATGPTDLERAGQGSNLLSIEWARVRQKPNLSNCLDLGQRNDCNDF